MKGKTDKEFAPNDVLTRGEVAVILNRLMVLPDDFAKMTLKDIARDTWYTNSVNNLNLEDTITRGEMAEILDRILEK